MRPDGWSSGVNTNCFFCFLSAVLVRGASVWRVRSKRFPKAMKSLEFRAISEMTPADCARARCNPHA